MTDKEIKAIEVVINGENRPYALDFVNEKMKLIKGYSTKTIKTLLERRGSYFALALGLGARS